MGGKTREEQRNKSHIHRRKDKGRIEKHYPYSYRERQGKNRETKAIFIEGKTREATERQGKQLKDITHIDIGKDKKRKEKRKKCHIDVGKDKGRIVKHYPYSYKERQGKNLKTSSIFT